MEHKTPLQELVDTVGLKPLAAKIDVSYQSVQKYLKTHVPAEKVIAIAQVSDWSVRPHDLRPDLYPNPEDGIPPDVRAAMGPTFARRAEDRAQ